MPSNYEEFYVMEETNGGVIEAVAGVNVEVYDADNDVALTTLVTDPDGKIAAGTLNVKAGTRVRFRVENRNGLAGSVTQITA